MKSFRLVGLCLAAGALLFGVLGCGNANPGADSPIRGQYEQYQSTGGAGNAPGGMPGMPTGGGGGGNAPGGSGGGMAPAPGGMGGYPGGSGGSPSGNAPTGM